MEGEYTSRWYGPAFFDSFAAAVAAAAVLKHPQELILVTIAPLKPPSWPSKPHHD